MNVAIIGASGYTGLELIKILMNHPKFNITYIANSTVSPIWFIILIIGYFGFYKPKHK